MTRIARSCSRARSARPSSRVGARRGASGAQGRAAGGRRTQPRPSEPKAPDAGRRGRGPQRLLLRVRARDRAARPTRSRSPPRCASQIGTDWDGRPAVARGPLQRTQWFPYYEERRGDYRLRLAPAALARAHARPPRPDAAALRRPADARTPRASTASSTTGAARRSSTWTSSSRRSGACATGTAHVVVVGPLVAPRGAGRARQLARAALLRGRAQGRRLLPLARCSSRRRTGARRARSRSSGPYFRDRTGTDVDMGVAPFYFHGDNGNLDGNRRTYTLIPPLLFYHREHELDSSTTTVVGPVIAQSDAEARRLRRRAALLPHPGQAGDAAASREEHTTLFPLFHYGHDPDELALHRPRLLPARDARRPTRCSRRSTRTPTTRNGATSLTAVGPVVPLCWNYRDRDLGVHAWALAPFFYTSDSPAGHDWLTPLVGRFETYGESRTWWVFPTLTLSSDTHGWEDDFHPLVYIGRSDDSSHTVVAPIFWDFANPKGRTTVGFPLYWRFADAAGRLGHPGRGQHALHCRSASRAATTGSSTSCRSSRTARTRRATSGTSSSASPATRATARRAQVRALLDPVQRRTPAARARRRPRRKLSGEPCRLEGSRPREDARERRRARRRRRRAVVSSPSEKRTLDAAASSSPIADEHRDGSAVPALHALRPTRRRPRGRARPRAPAPLQPGNATLVTCGTRGAPAPLTRAPGASARAARLERVAQRRERRATARATRAAWRAATASPARGHGVDRARADAPLLAAAEQHGRDRRARAA